MKKKLIVTVAAIAASFCAGMAFTYVRAGTVEASPPANPRREACTYVDEKGQPVAAELAVSTATPKASTPVTTAPVTAPPKATADIAPQETSTDLPTVGQSNTPWDQIQIQSDGALKLSGERGREFSGKLYEGIGKVFPKASRACIYPWKKTKPKEIPFIDVTLTINVETREDGMYFESASLEDANVADETLETCIAKTFSDVTLPVATGERPGERRRISYPIRWGLNWGLN